MLTPEDKDLLVKKGISEQQIAEQLACFEKGFPFLKLDAAASVEKGIMAPAENEMKNYLEAWDTYKEGEKTIVKFVPPLVLPAACSRICSNSWGLITILRRQISKRNFSTIFIASHSTMT